MNFHHLCKTVHIFFVFYFSLAHEAFNEDMQKNMLCINLITSIMIMVEGAAVSRGGLPLSVLPSLNDSLSVMSQINKVKMLGPPVLIISA